MMTHKGFPILLLIAAVSLLMLAVSADSLDGILVANAVARMAMVMAVAVIFSIVWINRRYDVDAQIMQHPVAVALYLAGVWIALAIAVAGAG